MLRNGGQAIDGSIAVLRNRIRLTGQEYVLQTKDGLDFFITQSGSETCFGWGPRHLWCWDSIANHISNPDVGYIGFLKKWAQC